MILLGQSTDGLWRIGRGGVVLHVCEAGEGLTEATAVAVKLKTPGEQLRRQFWHVSAPKPPGDIARVVEVGAPPKADPVVVITPEEIAELLGRTVKAIDAAITAGEWDEALTVIADEEEAGKNRVGVRRAVESRLDDLDL